LKIALTLINFPEKCIPKEWKIEHNIKLLEVNGRCEALEAILEFNNNDNRDFKKLLSTFKIQLRSKKILHEGSRLSKYSANKEILEFKSNKGHSRLFGFLSENSGSIIICTNGYWKTTGKKAKQDAAFRRADTLRNLYFD